MQNLNVDENLWSSNMLPEGTIECWYVEDNEIVVEGQSVAAIRVESALHDVVAPSSGRISIVVPASTLIEPGMTIATLAA